MVGAMKIRCMGKLSSSRRAIYEISMRMSVNVRVSGYVFTLLVAALLLTNGAAAQGQCDAADALLKAPLYDDALTNYTALLKQDPKLDCALNGINESQRAQAINSYELGRAYENASQVDLARNAYIEALKKNQTFTEAQQALEYLPGGNIPYWRDARSWIGRWGQPVGEIVIFLLGLYILISRIWPWLRSFYKEPRLDIQDFDKGATGLEIGKGMGAMMEESLMQLETSGGAHVHLVEAEMLPKIPVDVKSVSPQIKIMSDLIEWIIPSNVITLSGYLEKPGDSGAGLTLSIVENQTGNILSNITIWQKDYDPTATQSAVKDNDPVPYYCLVEPAAIWAHFQLRAAMEDAGKSAHRGINDWQSYAYLRAGMRWRIEGKDDKARLMFLNVLNRHENNLEALFNLGVMDTEAGEYERALERLELVRKDTKPDKIVWYKAEYQLAATSGYKGDLSKAEEEAKMLVKAIRETINELEKSKNKALKEFLISFYPMAVILYAGILVGKDNIKEAETQITSINQKKLSYRSRYNLACYYSHVGDNEKKKYSSTKAYQEALFHLEYALERGGTLVQWAQKDPSLKGVREFKETKTKFDEIIKKYGTSVPDTSDLLPLAGLAIIREAYARQLKEEGIFSHCDLILKADTPSLREELAKKLGISTTLLRRWALLADLMRIVGNTQYANLLEAADVGSLDALKKVSDPCELANLLSQVNKAQSLVKQLPPLENVQQWVQDARKTKPKVL